MACALRVKIDEATLHKGSFVQHFEMVEQWASAPRVRGSDKLIGQENTMRFRLFLSSALLCCFVLGWFAHVATAQRHTPVTFTRLYTGSDGQTHAEEITDIRLTADPARNGLETSGNIKVTGLQFVRTSPGLGSGLAPRRSSPVHRHPQRQRRNRGCRRPQDCIGARPYRSCRRRDREGPHIPYGWDGRPSCAEHTGCGAVVPFGERYLA